MSNDAPSQAVITVADRSTKTLLATIGNLGKVVAEVQGLSTIVEQLSGDIQQRESQLANIDTEIALRQRQAAANLNIQVLENERGVLATLMGKFGKADISAAELSQLKVALDGANADNAAAIEAAVKAEASKLHASYAGQLSSLKSEHAVQTATLTAQASAKDERIDFLANEVDQLRAQIAEERRARVQIAEADAKRQGVTISNGKQ